MFSIKAIDQDDINFEFSYVFATSEDCVHSYVSYFQRAVFVTLMLIFLTCLKSTIRWTFTHLKHNHIQLASFYHSPDRASFLDFLFAQSARVG